MNDWFKKSTANESFLTKEFNQISLKPKTTSKLALHGDVYLTLSCINCQAWKTISVQELTTDKNLFHSITIPSTTFSSKASNILFQFTRICLLCSCPIIIFFSHGRHTEPQSCQPATNKFTHFMHHVCI